MKVLILTEAGKDFGFGHLTRCIALNDAIKASAAVEVNLVVNGDLAAKRYLKRHHVKAVFCDWLKNGEYTLRLAKKSDILIVDSYTAPRSFYSRFFCSRSGGGPYVVAIDDYERIGYPANAVVNPSIYGDSLRYKKTARYEPLHLLGKDYVILRKEFWSVPRKHIRKYPRDILITFGAMRHGGIAGKILSFLLKEFPRVTFHIVTSGKIKTSPGGRVRSYSNLRASAMRALMLKCDIAVSAGGVTIYELIRTGIPSIGVCVAKNQSMNLKSSDERGLVKFAGQAKEKGLLLSVKRGILGMDYRTRESVSNACREAIDGLGARRIAGEILTNARGR